ncbi:MAG: transpeptidase family protein [Bacteroidia bacterium]|nr:transpeptidase family protein [Bacteroidia bacterium]
MDIKRDIFWRIAFVYIVALLLGVAIIVRIISIQISEGEELRKKAKAISFRDITVLPNRGDICADDGRLLATSVPYYEIRMDLKSEALADTTFKNNIGGLSDSLAGLFPDKKAEEYKNELSQQRQHGNAYYLIKRRVTYSQLERLRTFPIFKHGKNKGGLIVIERNKRTAPFAKLAYRTIGYLHEDKNGEHVGLVGLERAYERDLRGIKGIRLMQKIPGGEWIPIHDENEIEPNDGRDIITTININIQDVAENALIKQLKIHNAQYGSVVVLEVKTGEIKAIANLEKSEDGEYKESYNYAVGESIEPGSTFKLMSLIAGMEDNKFDLDDTVDTEKGAVQYCDQIMRDSKKGGYSKITVRQVFAYSSNVGVSKLITRGYDNNPQMFVDRLYAMNLHEKLGRELKGEGKPVIKNTKDDWSGVTLPWMSVGYEVRLTPLQILTFYNAIANNGIMVKPRFIKAIRYHGEIVQEFQPEIINPMICSKETIEKAKLMLKDVVNYGTGRNLKLSKADISGKTGTAQIAHRKEGYKQSGNIFYRASFVGYFPANAPKYSCIVVVNSPSNNVYYGNLVAGPIFQEIADKIYATSLDLQKDIDSLQAEVPYSAPFTKNGFREDVETIFKELNIKMIANNIKSDWVVTNMLDSAVQLGNRFIFPEKVPNVIGMGAKDAVFILENAGFKVIISGKGIVTNQSLEPGRLLIKGSEINLTLS